MKSSQDWNDYMKEIDKPQARESLMKFVISIGIKIEKGQIDLASIASRKRK